MEEIRKPKLIWFKGGLFLVLGIGSMVLLLVEAPTWKVGLLLALTVWALCRAYYFAFYVVEHYLDSGYRFSGLVSVARYLLRKKQDARDRLTPR